MDQQQKKAWAAVREYAMLTLATLIMVLGIYVFKFPNHFSFGGVTGIAILLSGAFGIPAGTITFVINMALLVVGFLFLGKGFGFKTVYVSVLMSAALSLLEKLLPMDAPLTTQPVLELIFAIVLPALGSAILFNIGASSGGTDILAMILRKYTTMNIGSALFLVDLAITITACFIYDIQTGLFSFCGLDGQVARHRRRDRKYQPVQVPHDHLQRPRADLRLHSAHAAPRRDDLRGGRLL